MPQKPRTAIERLMPKLRHEDHGYTSPCWVFTGYVRPQGYAIISGVQAGKRRNFYVHRLTWEQFRGPIPEGLTIDHLCRVRHCCNPEHLDVVTQQVNVLRGNSLSARRARQTHCRRGHPLVPGNLYHDPGHRICRTCKLAQCEEYRRRRAENMAGTRKGRAA